MKKIVIIGPESTGKSTLTKQLAEHYHTAYCPEYARAYLHANGTHYQYDDLLKIAQGQLMIEDTFVHDTENDLYFIDTDMYVMKVWSEYVFGKCDNFILENIVARKYDLYLLCNIDLPWVADELREYPDEAPRRELFNIYKDLLINQDVPFVVIEGNYAQRLEKAITAVEEVRSSK